jgi:dihydrofolate reductase
MEIPKIEETTAAPSLLVFRDLQVALPYAEILVKQFKLSEEIMVIGGTQIYQQCLPLADKIYLTILDSDYEGDAAFPDFEESSWNKIEAEEHEGFKYITYSDKKILESNNIK